MSVAGFLSVAHHVHCETRGHALKISEVHHRKSNRKMNGNLRARELIVYVPPDVNPRKVYKELVYPSEISLHGVNSVYLSLRFFTFVHVILSLVHVSSRH